MVGGCGPGVTVGLGPIDELLPACVEEVETLGEIEGELGEAVAVEALVVTVLFEGPGDVGLTECDVEVGELVVEVGIIFGEVVVGPEGRQAPA